MAGLGDKECRIGGMPLDPKKHRHRFRCRGCFIEKRGIGNPESREIADHGLKIQQCFQSPLCNLGLIWCVLCIPPGIFKDVSLDDGGDERVGVSHADQGTVEVIFRRNALQPAERFLLSPCRRQRDRPVRPDLLGNCTADKFIEG